MDCCSRIDFAHFRTSSKISCWLGSRFVPEPINFCLNFEFQNPSETEFIFERCFNPQSPPKCVPKGSQNAWSELGGTTLGPLWPHQAEFMVSKSPTQSFKKLILSSYGGQLDLFFLSLQAVLISLRGQFC